MVKRSVNEKKTSRGRGRARGRGHVPIAPCPSPRTSEGPSHYGTQFIMHNAKLSEHIVDFSSGGGRTRYYTQF